MNQKIDKVEEQSKELFEKFLEISGDYKLQECFLASVFFITKVFELSITDIDNFDEEMIKNFYERKLRVICGSLQIISDEMINNLKKESKDE